jgi:hypothetical protein
MTKRLQSKTDNHNAQQIKLLQTSSKDIYSFTSNNTNKITGGLCPITQLDQNFYSSKHFSTKAPYDPKKDAYIQDILNEFGRDFSAETQKSDDGIDSGYESDSETSLGKFTDASSSSSDSDSAVLSSHSESSSDCEEDTGRIDRKGQGQDNVVEVEGDTVVGHEGIGVEAEVKEYVLAEYEEIKAYSDEEEEFEEIYERIHVVPLQSKLRVSLMIFQ